VCCYVLPDLLRDDVGVFLVVDSMSQKPLTPAVAACQGRGVASRDGASRLLATGRLLPLPVTIANSPSPSSSFSSVPVSPGKTDRRRHRLAGEKGSAGGGNIAGSGKEEGPATTSR
jgi:hypothetical protein